MDNDTNAETAVASTGLLACPFCGCPAMTEGGGTSRKRGKLPLTVSCASRLCGVSMTGTRPEVIERWNARHANIPICVNPPTPEVRHDA